MLSEFFEFPKLFVAIHYHRQFKIFFGGGCGGFQRFHARLVFSMDVLFFKILVWAINTIQWGFPVWPLPSRLFPNKDPRVSPYVYFSSKVTVFWQRYDFQSDSTLLWCTAYVRRKLSNGLMLKVLFLAWFPLFALIVSSFSTKKPHF